MSGIYIPGIEMPKEAPIIVKICRDGDVCGIRGGIIAKAIPAADVRPVPETGIGDMSDGYHTFNALYYQRMMLTAALVKAYKDRAWKSYRHEDGEPCFGKDNYFIVGIDTPEGSYTYHYHGEYWDLFDCEELPAAKHWDGHTDKDVTRLLTLPDVRPVVRGNWIKVLPNCQYDGEFYCSVCGHPLDIGDGEETPEDMDFFFCPRCGTQTAANLETDPLASSLQVTHKWISVEKRLPGPYEVVLISILTTNGLGEPSRLETLASMDHGEWNVIPSCRLEDGERITHWMPMPESPKEET